MGTVKIKGFSKYTISEDGTITRVITGKGTKIGKIRKAHKGNHGYTQAVLPSDSGKDKLCLIHRLVAIAFIPNPYNLPCINHIDANKTNNSIDNLEWCTYSQNTRHAIEMGVFHSKGGGPSGERSGKSKLTTTQVLAIRTMVSHPAKEMAKRFNISLQAIYDVRNGRSWKHIPVI
jgi:hypothetical protein